MNAVATTTSLVGKRLIKRFLKGETKFTQEELETRLYGKDMGVHRSHNLACYMLDSGHRFSEDDTTALLTEINVRGVTAVTLMVTNRWRPKRRETLFLRDKTGNTVAHEMAAHGHIFPEDDTEVLTARNNLGHTVAHIMASEGYIFASLDMLGMTDYTDVSVAEILIVSGYDFPEDHPIWSIDDELTQIVRRAIATRTKIDSVTDIVLCRNRHLLDAVYADRVFTYEEYCAPVEKTPIDGVLRPLAHAIVIRGGVIPDDPAILSVRDGRGQTTAHYMANTGYMFSEDHECLGWKRNSGHTVAHEMAMNGYVFPLDSPILYYVSKDGVTVAHYMALAKYIFPEDHPVITLADSYKTTVGAYMYMTSGYIFDESHPVWRMGTVGGYPLIINALLDGHRISLEGDLIRHQHNGVFTASIMAKQGFDFPLDCTIMSTKTELSIQVAKVMAKRGYVFPDSHWACKYNKKDSDDDSQRE